MFTPVKAEAPIDPKPSVEAYIGLEALKWGLGADFKATLRCESHLIPSAIGDHGHSLGIAQINLPSHPDITKEEALDPYFAISWAAHEFSLGHQNEWTCYRLLHK